MYLYSLSYPTRALGYVSAQKELVVSSLRQNSGLCLEFAIHIA